MGVMSRWRRQLIIGVSLVFAWGGLAVSASDPTMNSSSYSVTESEVGGNGQFNSSSSNYSINPFTDDAGSSLGETAVGNSASSNYQSNAGFNTTAQPGLTMIVNSGSISLGDLSSTAATFDDSATFDVIDYTSSGYVVQVVGQTPSYGGHNLTNLATDTASSAGTEQFGINLVHNTVAGKGTDPQELPDSTFSFGKAGNNCAGGTYGTTCPYTIPDKYTYNNGDVIASSPKTSGDTKYTITFLANISNTTTAGHYTGSIDLVATGTF